MSCHRADGYTVMVVSCIRRFLHLLLQRRNLMECFDTCWIMLIHIQRFQSSMARLDFFWHTKSPVAEQCWARRWPPLTSRLGDPGSYPGVWVQLSKHLLGHLFVTHWGALWCPIQNHFTSFKTDNKPADTANRGRYHHIACPVKLWAAEIPNGRSIMDPWA